MRSEYAWLAPHDTPTVTGPNQIGIAFTGHDRIPYAIGDRTVVGTIRPGATIVSGPASVTWLRVAEPTEALEVYPDAGLLRATASPFVSRPVDVPPVIGAWDGTVLGIASILRRTHTSGAELTDVAASTLAHRLAAHLLARYAGIRPLALLTGVGRLDVATVDRVADLVDDRLGAALTLDDLAAAARLSPFHFARGFKETTGLSPHAFVTSRRMDRARVLLRTTGLPVSAVADAVGFRNHSHFRRTFRSHHGATPSDLRR